MGKIQLTLNESEYCLKLANLKNFVKEIVVRNLVGWNRNRKTVSGWRLELGRFWWCLIAVWSRINKRWKKANQASWPQRWRRQSWRRWWWRQRIRRPCRQWRGRAIARTSFSIMSNAAGAPWCQRRVDELGRDTSCVVRECTCPVPKNLNERGQRWMLTAAASNWPTLHWLAALVAGSSCHGSHRWWVATSAELMVPARCRAGILASRTHQKDQPPSSHLTEWPIQLLRPVAPSGPMACMPVSETTDEGDGNSPPIVRLDVSGEMAHQRQFYQWGWLNEQTDEGLLLVAPWHQLAYHQCRRLSVENQAQIQIVPQEEAKRVSLVKQTINWVQVCCNPLTFRPIIARLRYPHLNYFIWQSVAL